MLDSQTVSYEFPCNESIRGYLRLENLLNHFHELSSLKSEGAQISALLVLFDLVEICARNNLKKAIIEDLEKYYMKLARWTNHRSVDQGKLNETLLSIREASNNVLGISGQILQDVRDTEWLMLTQKRLVMATAACSCDLPQLHFWLSLPHERRQEDFSNWIHQLQPIEFAVRSILKFIRESMMPHSFETETGSFQYDIKNQSFDLVRITVPLTTPVIPDLSPCKYRLWIRFNLINKKMTSETVSQPIKFTLELA